MAKVAMIPIAGCWIWTAAHQPTTGYGRFGITSGEVEYAHRAAWRLLVGPIPAGLEVCHHCDVRMCVNPDHLFVGTRADNMQDASRKGRIVIPLESWCSSEVHQVAKLTNEQVRAIRASNASDRSIAKDLGVTIQTVWAARTRRTFKDVA